MKKIAVSVLVLGLCFIWAMEADAITAWARKYGADCSMCHWKQNKLNAQGKEFLRRGHRMQDESSRTKDGAWSNLSDYVSLTQKIRYVKDSESSDKPGFFVEALALYGGGPIDNKFSYFFEQYLHENNKAGADREKLAESYLMFTSGKDNNFITFRVGQIAPYLVHVNGTGGRIPVSRPYVLESASFAGNNPYAVRGRQYGIETALNLGDLYGSVGVVNGTGHKNINPSGDTNADKDVYVTIDKNLDDNGSNVGIYAYKGKWSLTAANAATLGLSATYVADPGIDYNQVGILGNYTNSMLSFTGGALTGNNSPIGGAATNNLGYYAQVEYAPSNILAVYSRYDNWDKNTAASSDEEKQLAVGFSVEPLSSGRFAFENQTTTKGTAAATNKFTAELQYMY